MRPGLTPPMGPATASKVVGASTCPGNRSSFAPWFPLEMRALFRCFQLASLQIKIRIWPSLPRRLRKGSLGELAQLSLLPTASWTPHGCLLEAAKLFWADHGGPQIYHLYFYLFAAGPKNTKYPRTGLLIGVRADFWRNLHYLSSRNPCQGSRGPAVGPKGPKIGQKNGARFII
jgi:hypothetical protein